MGLSDEDVRGFFASGKVCGDDRGVIDGRHTGAVRLSFGVYSTWADVDRWMDLLMHFVDQLPEEVKQEESSILVSPELSLVCHKSVQMVGTIRGLKIYPVKGCGALHVKRWPMEGASLFLDRRWCLTLAGRKRPVSAKQAPRLTNVKLSLKEEEKRFVLVLSSKFHPQKLLGFAISGIHVMCTFDLFAWFLQSDRVAHADTKSFKDPQIIGFLML